ncbi:hypothetical protein D9M73_90850 [compost metagenome]
MQHAATQAERELGHRTPGQLRFAAPRLRLVGVEQQAVIVGVVAVQLDVVDLVVEARRVEAQRVAEQVRLDAGFIRRDRLRRRGDEGRAEHGVTTLDRRPAETVRNAREHVHIRLDRIVEAAFPARLGIGEAHIARGRSREGRYARCVARRRDEARGLFVIGHAYAAGQRQLGEQFVARLAKTGIGRVDVAQDDEVVRVRVGPERIVEQEETALVEFGRIARFKVDAADLPLETPGAIAGQTQFLAQLVEIANAALALAIEFAAREIDCGTAIGVAAAIARRRFIRSDRGQRDRAEIVLRVERAAIGPVRLWVVMALIERDAVARFGADIVGAELDRAAMEDRRSARVIARMRRNDAGEAGFGRGQHQLEADVLLLEAAELVLAADGAVIARAGIAVVDPVIATLIQTRHAEREHVLDDRPADAGVDRHGVVTAIGRRRAAFIIVGRLVRVELDDAGRGVAAEQRALRPAQHFDLVHVEHRVGLQHDMLEHDIVLDDRHGLRGAEVEIDIAEAANVEAREDLAGGRLGVKAGDAVGEFEQRIAAARREVAQIGTLQHADRNRHLLQVLAAALRGDDDIAEIIFCGGRLRRCGSSRSILRAGSAGTGKRDKRGAEQECGLCDE